MTFDASELLLTLTPPLLIGILIYTVFKFGIKSSSGLKKDYYRGHWRRLNELAGSSEEGRSMAIIQADKLFDRALRERRYGGESMADRMRSAESSVGKNYQNLWDAHKLRNRLVHETDVKLKINEMKFALRAYEKALKDLGAL